MQENITERVKYLIRYYMANYKAFEDFTGVSASKWRDLDRGKTKSATIEMLEALCATWPEFTCWIVTGSTTLSRNQTSIDMYFGSAHGLSVLEPGNIEFKRNELGHLSIEGLVIEHWATDRSTEIAFCERVLKFSGFSNEIDSKKLSPIFWEEFISPISNNTKWIGKTQDIKKWINQFDITPMRSSDTETLLSNFSTDKWIEGNDN